MEGQHVPAPNGSNGNGSNGSPWWAKTVTTLYTTLGPSTIVLFIFVLAFVGWVDSPLLQAHNVSIGNQELIKAHITMMNELHEKQTKWLWAICLNTAPNKIAEERCQRYLAFQQP